MTKFYTASLQQRFDSDILYEVILMVLSLTNYMITIAYRLSAFVVTRCWDQASEPWLCCVWN